MSGTQNAATGNPLIPSHPEISTQRASAGATQSPPNQQQQAPAAPASVEMDWGALMGLDGEEPQADATAAPGAQAPGAQPQQPGQGDITPEQKVELARTAMEQQAAAPPVQQGQPMTVEQATSIATKHLLDTTYKLDDAQKKQLISEPDVAIPQLAARMHVQIATQIGQFVQQAIQQVVPQLALQTMKQQMGAFRAEQAFFGQYPALNNPKFKPVVLQMLKYAKALNPQADRATIMREAAEMAAFKLKVNIGQQQQAPQQQQGRPNGQQAAPVMPFTPAMSTGPTQAIQPNAEQNPFEALASENDW